MSLPDANIETEVLSHDNGVAVNDYFMHLDEEDLIFLRLSCNIESVIDIDEYKRKRDKKINN